MTTRLVQIQRGPRRAVARVEEPLLRLLNGVESIYELAMNAAARRVALPRLVDQAMGDERLEYEPVYHGTAEWRLLVPIDHPEPSRCLVSGTGLTHLGSASSRNAMHNRKDDDLTDSMRIFRAGLEGGRPAPGLRGVAPEWFYKGTGSVLRGHNDDLVIPPFAEDGGEEAEVAGVYLIDASGQPCRIGMTAGNEFSDHQYERRNYLHLAGSKLRSCALGPEIVLDPVFDMVPGHVAVERAGQVIWEREIATGEREMCHSVANIEDHHFKYEGHRRPGDVHVHYFGAHSLSFADGVRLEDGDVMSIRFEGFGRPLRNRVRVHGPSSDPLVVRSLA